MSRDVGQCPPAFELERLLAEQLSAAERETVEMHVEGCTTCQDRLDQLIRESAKPVKPAAEQWPEPSAAFLSRLRETPPPAGDRVEASPWLVRSRVGQYEVLEKLGKGGMGAVYKARHVELGKVVALKVLPTDNLDEVRVERFKNEVRAIGKLDHPHIVAAHDAGESGGVHYLVMDLVDGEDLGRVVERQGRLKVPDASEAIRQAAIGLQHAFQRGLIHRDIKPTNLMLTRAGRVQLLDLGLARSFHDRSGERLTADGIVLGTADYLAPEQWERPQSADIRADIYSLGCTLYHLLAGQPPFAGGRFGSILQKLRGHVETPPPPITSVRDDVPPGLAAVLERMLAKSPADRFATPAEVAEALQPFAASADLARLAGPGPTTDASHGPDTENLPSTLTENRTRRGSSSPGTRSRRYVIPLALAGAAAVLVITALVFWPRKPADPRMPAAIRDLRVAHYHEQTKDVEISLGDLRTSTALIRSNDLVTVAADLNVPAYYYLIAFNPAGSKDGIEQLCQPDGPEGFADPAAQPAPRREVRYPRDDGRFRLDAAGWQVFVLAASTRPLPPFQEWRDNAGELPWKGTDVGDTYRWHFDGQLFHRLPEERGRVEIRGMDVPKSLVDLRDWFLGRSEFDAVQIIAFPVKNGGE